MAHPGLRERKKQRTRRALFEAAMRSFSERGYEQTTVADIAAAADVSPRTFFSYYPSKEQVVFYDAPERSARALAVIANRRAGEPPIDLLVRAVREAVELFRDEPVHDPVRLRLIETVPALRAHQLRLTDEGQRRLSTALLTACPGELTELDARIAASALMAAVVSASVHARESGHPDLTPELMTERAIHLVVHGLRSFDGFPSHS